MEMLAGPSLGSGSSVLSPGWQYVSGTYDGNIMRLYINGVSVAVQGYAGGVGVPASFSNNIGTLGLSPGTYFNYLGPLDDFRIYNRALSASEIAALYAGGK